MTDPTPRPSRLLRLAAVLAPWALGTVLAMWLVVGAAWGALHGWIVPRIADFRPQLESLASRTLGTEVRIGAISARSSGLLPSFELQDVVLRDADGLEGLRLARVHAQMSPRALLRRGFEQIVVDGPVLELRRTADGRLLVAGLDMSGRAGEDGDGRAADWVFAQRELAVRQATVRWTDERLGLPTVELSGADLVIRNGTRSHRIRLDATPPAAWGQRFSLRADMRQSLLNPRRGDWREWNGVVYAEFPEADLAQLRARLDPGLLGALEMQAGRGLLRAWADVVHGEVLGGQLDLALADASARLGAGLEPLALSRLQGRLRLRQLAGGLELQTEQLRFATVDGADWPEGDVFLSFMRGESRVPGQGELRVDRIDLAALAEVAARLPLPQTWHAGLVSLAPRGRVDALQLQWTGRIEAPASYRARGRVHELALAAGPLPPRRPDLQHPAGRPGVSGLAASFDLTADGGQATLEMADGALEFPGVFEQPRVPLERLQARLRWQHEGERLELQVPELQFANADAAGQLQARWRSGGGPEGAPTPGLGTLALDGKLTRADGTRVHRYLPLAVDQEARHYVRDAVQRGRASAVQFRVEGALDDFPYDRGRQGTFQVSAEVEDVRYAYVPARLQDAGEPPWPALTGLAGRLLFDRNGMQVRGARGQLEGVPGFELTRAEADIPDFDAPEVAVRADGRGPLAAMLGMVAASPAAALTDHVLDPARATGAAELSLRLALPLDRLEHSRVQGSVQLAGNDVRLKPEAPLLARARGSVAFSDRGFTLTGVQAGVLGGEVRLEGGLEDGALAVRAQGVATAAGLRQTPELGALARLAERFDGSTGYTATLAHSAGGAPAVTLESTLQGLAMRLPAPLDKPADANWPLRAALAPQAGTSELLSLRLGTVLEARVERDAAGLRRGAVGVGLPEGTALPLPETGFDADLRLEQLPLDAWLAVLGDVGAEAAAPQAGALPQRFTLRAGTLQWSGHRLHQLAVQGTHQDGAWQAEVEARELAGRIVYREGRGDQPGSVQARLARLAITAGGEDEVTALLDEQPASVPALDIVVQDFQLRGRALGRLEVQAVNQDRDWLLNRLVLDTPEAHLAASGRWGARAGASGRRSSMDFRLDVQDAGALLARLGMPEVFRRGDGHLQGQVAWSGSPLALDYPSLDGNLRIDVRNGQFLKADAGPARLLGVLSLQALPRRLTLDFRDLFSEGFAFDFLRGDAQIARGVVGSNNLQMKGVNAAVLMDGRADIARETQQLRVVVVPEINAGTASLVATVINPAIGLGTFLAQWVLRRPLMDAATREFQIDGTWADPRIERVARSHPTALTGAADDEPQKGARQ